ncbi:hypothetical protein [Pseudoduganella chitinolytica]|uniref:Uncharacterized protein n=1 Tax=Pseudoduganella chitinolytica TaxID=34070 RepID=A0ABY8BEY0_9BURK|nr:hypothetical protein [Pseudoduganella chitinolytica]WEF34375.1 hypothetical protein PX653_06265 [Pseudoduganella chitinolytica]
MDDDTAGQQPTIGTGFAAFQLAKALMASVSSPDAAARERAAGRVASWEEILGHLFAGSASYGSRTPIDDVPAWATLEVMTGGFATGRMLAGGPLQPYEHQLLDRIVPAGQGKDRLALNLYFLTDAGLGELQAWLRSGHYDVRVPEEGALLTVAWLAANGHADAARDIVAAIAPFFPTLRFYPVPDYRPRHFGPRVHVQEVGAVARQLADIRPNRHVIAQKRAAEVWAPLHDRALSLFAETMGDEFWPCQQRPVDWSARVATLLAEYAAQYSANQIPAKYRKPGSHHAQLHAFLQRCATSFETLTGRDVGRIRHILRCSVAKRGMPAAPSSQAYRRRQMDDVRAPLYADIATVVGRRLASYPAADGLDDIESVQQSVAPDEGSDAVPAGTAIPRHIARKLERCMNETPELLVRRGLISSGEVLATVLPQLTSGLRSLGIDDPALRGLYAAIYRAFRRRRSLLLLDLQSQVRLEELPWVAAIEGLRNENLSSRAAARQALEATTLLALEFFPHAILPNRLVRELGALATSAGVDVPLVEELATDIFMGEFSPKFLDAARVAGTLLRGSLYATYYGIDYDAVDRLGADSSSSATFTWPWQKARMRGPDFAALCAARAGVALGSLRPATNGMIIEQQQILTTQNLAPLVVRLDLRAALQGRLQQMARSCFKWICARNQRQLDDWHGRLLRVKNSAYAWRQMIFFLSLLPSEEVLAFLAWADEFQARQSPAWQRRFQPAMHGLRGAVEGSASQGNGPFLGWSDSRHWLME